jgi:hypothetical protein
MVREVTIGYENGTRSFLVGAVIIKADAINRANDVVVTDMVVNKKKVSEWS